MSYEEQLITGTNEQLARGRERVKKAQKNLAELRIKQAKTLEDNKVLELMVPHPNLSQTDKIIIDRILAEEKRTEEPEDTIADMAA